MRLSGGQFVQRYHIFQSTHPGWGATGASSRDAYTVGISIHAPRVGCDVCVAGLFVFHHISIHAPRVGCDCPQGGKVLDPFDFNPRTPGGVRRGDCLPSLMRQADFNPRTPGGVRLFGIFILRPDSGFQSTHPGWGATFSSCFPPIQWIFQSTHPGWGATSRHRRR